MTEEVEETFVDILLLAAVDEGHHQMMVLQLSSLALTIINNNYSTEPTIASYLEEVAFQLDLSPLMMMVVQIFVIPWAQLWEAPCLLKPFLT